MCLAVPSKIISINDYMATVDVYGARRDVSLVLLPEEPRVGDFVLVHAGYAIQSISRETVESGEVMHESSIALSILDILNETCRREGMKSVTALTVRIGRAAGVNPDSLVFVFDSLKSNTVAENAVITVEAVPVGGRCRDCGKEFDAGEEVYIFSCPHCGSSSFTLESGREMEIVDMELA